ncbi:accessory gene regulator B family protein, partial [Paenibacillus sp. MCAF20]
GLSLLIGVFTGRVFEVAIVLIGFALLRQASGGLHLKSGLKCVAVSTAGATILSFVELSQVYMLASTGIAVTLALIFAPTNIEKQSRIPHKYYPALKLLAVLMVSSNFLIQSDVLAAAFLAQGITLIFGRR